MARFDGYARSFGAPAESRAARYGRNGSSLEAVSVLPVRKSTNSTLATMRVGMGLVLSGSGQRIVPPESLVATTPDLLIITNPTYADEIKGHAARLGLSPEFWIL